jgi:hypothetical protein
VTQHLLPVFDSDMTSKLPSNESRNLMRAQKMSLHNRNLRTISKSGGQIYSAI